MAVVTAIGVTMAGVTTTGVTASLLMQTTPFKFPVYTSNKQNQTCSIIIVLSCPGTIPVLVPTRQGQVIKSSTTS